MSSTPLHDPLAPPAPGASDRNARHDVLHVRVPLRHPGPSARRRNPLHRRQSRSSAQPGRDLRQGLVRHHEAVLAGAPRPNRSSASPAATAAPGNSSQISWDEAFALLEERLRKIRATDPKRFALFTGRDQMQALTGLFARQFGTPNYAAHGGFCSVNMAAGMIYTIGGSFWEFGGPDLDARPAVRDARHGGGPPFQSAEDRDLQVQARRRAGSSRSTRSGRAIRPSPTTGCRSSPAPTARCCSR